jgi:hypothetical protein
MHRTTERFWECYSNLPQDIQELADKNFRLGEASLRRPEEMGLPTLTRSASEWEKSPFPLASASGLNNPA